MSRRLSPDGKIKIPGGTLKAYYSPPPASSADRHFSAETKRIVRRIYGNKCSRPGCDTSYGLHFDHILPHSRGGTSELSNCQLLCATHNLSKGNRLTY